MRLAVSCFDDIIAYAVDFSELIHPRLANSHDIINYLMLAVG